MPFTGNEDHLISLTTAAALTKGYRDTVAATATIAHYFGKAAIMDLLNQENCVGMRVYYGIDTTTGAKKLVLTGVDAEENDLYEGMLLDKSMPCPTNCSSANPLNTTY
jgi:hypothetical protein